MYPGSLKSTRYLLVTEFEDRSAFYGPSFFRSDLWPKHKARKGQTSSPGFCWCLLQRKTVYFENSDNTLTQFGRFMLLINQKNVC